MTRPTVEVVRPGPLTLVQDEGRSGWAHLGVPRSGAADLPALRRANAVVGNEAGTAALETVLGGLVLRFPAGGTVGVAGAVVTATVAGPGGERRPADIAGPVEVPPGGTLRLGRATRGLRVYVAVQGGIDVPPVLGSRSRDTLSGLGPEPLATGDVLPVGASRAAGADVTSSGSRAGVAASADQAGGGDLATGDRSRPSSAGPALDRGAPAPPGTDSAGWPPGPLRVLLGPRADWFEAEAVRLLAGSDWTVSPDSDRVGVRLSGPPLPRRIPDELPSEGLVLGALQVPPQGRPILMLADHPVTGGYPVIGVVLPVDLPVAAQARPGERLRFRVVG